MQIVKVHFLWLWDVAEPPIVWAGEDGATFLLVGQVLKGVASPSLVPGFSLVAQNMWGRYRSPLTGILLGPGVPDVAGPPRARGEDRGAVHHA